MAGLVNIYLRAAFVISGFINFTGNLLFF